MIDYLELLLDGQEQEEGAETQPLGLSAFDPAMVRMGGGVTAASQTAQPGSVIVEQTAAVGAVEDLAKGAIEDLDGRMAEELAEAAGIPGRPIRVRSVSIRPAGKEVDGNVVTARITADGDSAAAAEKRSPGENAAAGMGGVSTEAGSEPVEGKMSLAQAVLWSSLRQGQRGASGYSDAGGDFSLYRQMVQAGRAVGGLRQSAKVMTVSENAVTTATPGAAELDEIFARDARRYDSGFSLY